MKKKQQKPAQGFPAGPCDTKFAGRQHWQIDSFVNVGTGFLSNKVIFILLIVAVVVVYINTLGNQFVWDDEVVIVGNPYIKNWKYLKEVLTTGIFGEKTYAGSYFRPVQNFSFLIDYTIWKLNPLGYHISNILLHCLNTILIFLLLTRLKLQKNITFFSALLFAIHPANTEAVTYLSARGNMFAFLFEILCFLAILKLTNPLPCVSAKVVAEHKIHRKILYSIMSVVLLILAILSKETTVILPIIILLWYFCFSRTDLFNDKNAKKIFLWTISFMLLISAAYVCTRLFAIETSTTGTLSLIKNASLSERILTVPKILLTYVRLFILPINQHMEYHFVEKSITSPSVWGSLILLWSLLYFLWKFVQNKHYASFFLGWFLLGISPFTNVLVPIHTTVAESWFYFPSIGLITISVSGIIRLYETKPHLRKFLISSSVLIGILFSFATIRRNYDWSEPMRLYSHDLKYEPRSFLLHNNLGVEYFRRGMMAQAKQKFIDSIKTSPRIGYDMAFNNLGVIYENEGNIEKAIENFKLAISANNNALAYGNLGRVYLTRNELDKAIILLEEGIKHHPESPDISYFLGLAYYFKGNLVLSEKILLNLQSLHPNFKNTKEILTEISQIKSRALLTEN